MSILWSIFCSLPAWVRVGMCAAAWFAFCELLALFLSVGTRYDRKIDRERERQREAFSRPLPQARQSYARHIGTVRH